jgi:hypothetical protein
LAAAATVAVTTAIAAAVTSAIAAAAPVTAVALGMGSRAVDGEAVETGLEWKRHQRQDENTGRRPKAGRSESPIRKHSQTPSF